MCVRANMRHYYSAFHILSAVFDGEDDDDKPLVP